MGYQAELLRARECFARRAWREAHHRFVRADQDAPLAAGDLEACATAAYLIGHDREFQTAMERAFHARSHEGARPRAARCAFWLSLLHLLSGDAAQANGWVARAQRLIDGLDCVERGYLRLPLAEQRLMEGDIAETIREMETAVAVGERFADADLAACARHVLGRAHLQAGRLREGFALLDDAMLAASGGELSPIITGLVYCSVIDACQHVFAFARAREWTEALTRWCEDQPELVAFTGICRVHRAEVLQLRGAWVEALRETTQAEERGRRGVQRPPAAAFYRRGEILRLRGELDAAEESYRLASERGCEPQPGLALLWLAQGRTGAACAAIRRVLGSATDPLHRAKLLPAHVEIALAARELGEAQAAARELAATADRFATGMLRALAAYAQGTVELASGRPQAALAPLREAAEHWQQLDAPYEVARARLELALACRDLGDVESSQLDFDAARATFERLGAAPDLARLDTVRAHAAPEPAHGVTPRELQVLRRIATGMTNKAIASELRLSERTVDRHVSNLLTKLGVSSRAAATAWAYDHKLL